MEPLCPICAAPQSASERIPCKVCGAVFTPKPSTSTHVLVVPKPPPTVTVTGDTRAITRPDGAPPMAERGTVTFRWSGGGSVGTVLFLGTAFVVGVTWFERPDMIARAFVGPGIPYVFFAFPIIIALSWLLDALLGSTRVIAGEGRIRIVRRPLPLRAIELDVTTLRQLFVRRHTYATRNSGTETEWVLCAIADGKVIEIVRTLEVELVRYLERAIEVHLGIPDEPTATLPRPAPMHVDGRVGPIDADSAPAIPERGALRARWRWLGMPGLTNDILSMLVAGFVILVAVFSSTASAQLTLGVAVPVASLFVYWLVARLVNHTEVTLERGRLLVRHGPIPWFGNRELDATALTQLVVQRGLSADQRVLVAETNASRTTLARYGTVNELVYVEQLVERYLGIVDRPLADDD